MAASADGPSISLPKGGGALHGIGEKFAPDLHTGTGNFTVPIAVPAGRNGFQPTLNLVYSTGNEHGAMGLGWSLSVPGVARKTAKGVPRYDDEKDVFILSGAEDLVPIEKTVDRTRYRPRTEGLFARIHHHCNGAENYWRVETKDGLVSLYGSPRPPGAPSDWRDPAVIVDPDNPGHVFAWKLSLTTDPFGNRIEYSYDSDSPSRDGAHHWDQRYVSEIRYADYGDLANRRFMAIVRFVYEPAPDSHSSYRAGFEIRTARRCARIEVLVNPQVDGSTDVPLPVRTYFLDFVDRIAERSTEVPANGVSLLGRIRVVGHKDGASEELPPLVFRYSAFEPGRREFQALDGPDLPPLSLASPNVELVDLHGHGLPDVLELDGVVRYWRNLGGGRFDSQREMTAAPAGLRLSDPTVQLLDADGDGRADLMVTAASLSGYYGVRFGASWDERSFQPYREAPSFNLKDPEVRLVDLDGDGVTDAIRSGDRLECFFNDPQAGWVESRWVDRRPAQEFPDVSFSDPRVRWADMSGDGLQDIVCIHDGSVEYWPSFGRGNWGRRIEMSHSPRFPAGYDPKRILLGDVDGDGVADLVYVDDARVTLWINQSGNRWSDPIVIDGTPPVSDTDAIRLTDVLGVGVSGVLWSAEDAGYSRARMFFLDFTGGTKPYLLCEMDNQMGAVTKVEYASSTRFFLADEERRGQRWQTPLPFPVQVVARVEVIDYFSRSKLATAYDYHHGYWDGAEREFRGFGRVDHRDTQTFDAYHGVSLHGAETPLAPVPQRSFSAPLEIRTWFHQGPIGDEFGGWDETDFSPEFWPGDPPALSRPAELTDRLKKLPRRARRDALRTLRGSVLRTELYAQDGTPLADLPYTVTEHTYGVREENPPAAGDALRPRIFYPHASAERTTQWERGSDPMTRLQFTSDYDQYGQARCRIDVAVPRRRDFRLASAPGNAYLATLTDTTFAQRDDTVYIVDRVAAVTTRELADGNSLEIEAFVQRARTAVGDQPVVAHTVHHYDGPEYEGLAPGRLGDFGALVATEHLVMTPAIVVAAYGASPPYLAEGHAPQWTQDYPPEFQARAAGFGYVFRTADPVYQLGYYAWQDRRSYDFHDPAAVARRGLVVSKMDPLGNETHIGFDRYGLFPERVQDASGLVVTARYDYRVGQPDMVTDPNGSRTVESFTPLGLLASTAVMGREGALEGDDGGVPSVRYEYDLRVFDRGQPTCVRTIRRVHHSHDLDVPAADRDAEIVTREYSDGFGRLLQIRTQGEQARFGADPFGTGVLPLDFGGAGDTALVSARLNDDPKKPNVVVSGWQAYDNKSRIVEKFEPFFSEGWDYGTPTPMQLGERATLFYDPRGEVVRTTNPDGSEQRVVHGVPGTIAAPDLASADRYEPTPWEAYTYDANDNAGRTHRDDPSVQAYPHQWNTPARAIVDALGRVVQTVEFNRRKDDHGAITPLEEVRTRSVYDIQGNLLEVEDALGRRAFRYIYDLAKQVLLVDQLDAGLRRTVRDAAGHPVEQRDSKGALLLHAYDELQWPIRLWARDEPGVLPTLRERLEYGNNKDPAASAAHRAASRLGRLVRHYDEAGRLTIERYDFKGNVAEKSREVIRDSELLSVFAAAAGNQWKVQAYRVDWGVGAIGARAQLLLDPQVFRTSLAYDALNRVVRTQFPADVAGTRSTLTPHYNHAGALERIVLDGVQFVRHISYNTKGQRTLVAYGNNTITRYGYHAKTFRLKRLRSETYVPQADLAFRPGGAIHQDFGYEYDLSGNILAIRDRTPRSGIPNKPLGPDALDRAFTYDTLYRLLSATGREADLPPLPEPWNDTPRGHDPTLVRAYSEAYAYDLTGNLQSLGHSGAPGRTFELAPGSNRLQTVRIGASPFAYAHDPNGNLTDETGSRHFEWDHSDRMRAFRTQTAASEPTVHAHYLNSSSGQRVKRVVRKRQQTEVTVWVDGLFEYHRITGANSVENNTIHVMDTQERVALVRRGPALAADIAPATRYELADHLGSSNVALDSTGALLSREEYTPYGETSFGSTARKRYRFTGKERDEETGLFYHGARYFAPWLALWLSADPDGVAEGVNPYSYVHRNPMRYIDPQGRGWSEWRKAATLLLFLIGTRPAESGPEQFPDEPETTKTPKNPRGRSSGGGKGTPPRGGGDPPPRPSQSGTPRDPNQRWEVDERRKPTSRPPRETGRPSQTTPKTPRESRPQPRARGSRGFIDTQVMRGLARAVFYGWLAARVYDIMVRTPFNLERREQNADVYPLTREQRKQLEETRRERALEQTRTEVEERWRATAKEEGISVEDLRKREADARSGNPVPQTVIRPEPAVH